MSKNAMTTALLVVAGAFVAIRGLRGASRKALAQPQDCRRIPNAAGRALDAAPV